MDRSSIRKHVLNFLYERYEEFGREPHMVSQEEMAGFCGRTGIAEADVRRAFRDLVERRLAEGRFPEVNDMRPEDGMVWISPEGRQLIEDEPVPPPVVHVVLAGMTERGRSEYAGLLREVGEEQRAQLREMLEVLLDEGRPEKDRLEQAANVATLVQTSPLLANLFVAVGGDRVLTMLSQFTG